MSPGMYPVHVGCDVLEDGGRLVVGLHRLAPGTQKVSAVSVLKKPYKSLAGRDTKQEAWSTVGAPDPGSMMDGSVCELTGEACVNRRVPAGKQAAWGEGHPGEGVEASVRSSPASTRVRHG